MVVWGKPGQLYALIWAIVVPVPYKHDNRRVDVTKLSVLGSRPFSR